MQPKVSGKVYVRVLGVTLTQGEAKLWLQMERQQDSHVASLLFSLFCLKAFSLLYLVALDTLLYLYVWGHLHSFAFFCVLAAFFSHYVSVSSLLLFCHTSFAYKLDSTLHTPLTTGPRAISRNT